LTEQKYIKKKPKRLIVLKGELSIFSTHTYPSKPGNTKEDI